MIKRPNFFIVGASRCGTTSMHSYLSAHPDIYMPAYKEPHYFATDFEAPNPWAKRFKEKANYLKLFSDAKEEKVLGEASSMYLFSKDAARNIKKFSPSAKIIIMLRSPVEMMYSLYNHLYYGGVESADTFEKALLLEKDRIKGKSLPKNQLIIKELYQYRGMAMFHDQVKRFYKHFNKSQIKIIIFDDFKKDTKKVYKETLSFLGVNPDFKISFEIINSNKQIKSNILRSLLTKVAFKLNSRNSKFLLSLYPMYKKLESTLLKEVRPEQMKEQTKIKLKKEFRPEVIRLGKLIGKNLNYWCK